MPELIVITFETEAGADEARHALRKLPREQMALIEEALTAKGGDVDSLGFSRMRTQSSRLITVPRSLAAAAFTGTLKATAWALGMAGTVGGSVIRGAQRIDRRSVKEIETKVTDAKSTLFLLTEDGVPIEMVELLAEQEAEILHTTISVDNAEVLRNHLQPE